MSDLYSLEHLDLKDILAISLREKTDSAVVTSLIAKFDNPQIIGIQVLDHDLRAIL